MSDRKYMTVAEFKTLGNRDWENGAVRDELYESIKRMEALQARLDAVKECHQYDSNYHFLGPAMRVKDVLEAVALKQEQEQGSE